MATVYSYMRRLMPMFSFVSISDSIRVNFAILPLHNVWFMIHFLYVCVCICVYCLLCLDLGVELRIFKNLYGMALCAQL